MNSDTEILIADILAESGAVEKCSICHDFMILADDEDAESVAYGMATNAWKSGERGFRGMEREEVMSLIKRALIHSPSKCPSGQNLTLGSRAYGAEPILNHLSASRTKSTEAGRERTGGFGIGDEQKPTFVVIRFALIDLLRTWLTVQKLRNPGQARRASFAGLLRDRRLCEEDWGGRA